MLDPLWHLNGMISAFLYNLSACCLPSSFCSRGYMVWKMMMFEEFQDGCLVLGNLWYANGMILAIWVSLLLRPSTKILLKRIYGLKEDVGWRIPRWLFSAWSSLICEYGIFSYSESLCWLRHPPSFCSKDYMGWKRCFLKINNMAIKFLVIFYFWMEWFLLT